VPDRETHTDGDWQPDASRRAHPETVNPSRLRAVAYHVGWIVSTGLLLVSGVCSNASFVDYTAPLSCSVASSLVGGGIATSLLRQDRHRVILEVLILLHAYIVMDAVLRLS